MKIYCNIILIITFLLHIISINTIVEFCEKSVFYLHDEGDNVLGCNRCNNSCDCDGLRTCSQFQWCQGISREKSIDYYYNEELSDSLCDPLSPLGDYYCNGDRVCDPNGKCIDKPK
jgi:hypothetical protein